MHVGPQPQYLSVGAQLVDHCTDNRLKVRCLAVKPPCVLHPVHKLNVMRRVGGDFFQARHPAPIPTHGGRRALIVRVVRDDERVPRYRDGNAGFQVDHVGASVSQLHHEHAGVGGVQERGDVLDLFLVQRELERGAAKRQHALHARDDRVFARLVQSGVGAVFVAHD
ncbi:MAG: hypothetical protein BWZ07_03276 [Alphaproteobacteria bacterium ADurb.BinA280]|nr:MAG: hypothetical protein BWZ07_03276 [Alphaproteobacteria bacterium ADurb.BinA280]